MGIVWIALLLAALLPVLSLREFRTWSTRESCLKSEYPNYPFAYSKYSGQELETKGRVNSNMQDLRHSCAYKGGKSKCHICEDITCTSDLNRNATANGTCALQLQGIRPTDMSMNIPIVSDTAWAVGGSHRRDYGHKNTSHFCVMTTGGKCIDPRTEDFTGCTVRCFGWQPTGGSEGTILPNYTQTMTASIVDVYRNMHQTSLLENHQDKDRWPNDAMVDLWQYPRNCTEKAEQGQPCALDGPGMVAEGTSKMPGPKDFNPQGFTFRLAGSGEAGFSDGDGDPTKAMFNGPEDVTLDDNSVIYVADTGNHAIRMVSSNGTVRTLAGRLHKWGEKKGEPTSGYYDGPCHLATFNTPKGIDVKLMTQEGTGREYALIMIADTGNHRIRKMEFFYNDPVAHEQKECTVSCFSGLCGNNTLSETDYKKKSWPVSGYADGPGDTAKFSAPESVAFVNDSYLAVADTGNYLIRYVESDGLTWTLAGGIANGTEVEGRPLGGCPPPCLVGVEGYSDGSLHEARFYNPRDVTVGINGTLYIADEHRIRILELPYHESEVQSIKSMGRVSTLAGKIEVIEANGEVHYDMMGQDDGIGNEATFFGPSGVFVSDDGIAYVTDAASCRIRRLTPMAHVAEPIKCGTKPHEIVRPSGCTSYDQAIDKIGRKVSRVEKNIQYNYGPPYLNVDLNRGKYIKNCVGIAPPDVLDKHFVLNRTEGLRQILPKEFWDAEFMQDYEDNLVIDDDRVTVNEDSEQGMAIIVRCDRGCLGTATADFTLEGTRFYSDNSSICMAALHDGKLTDEGGYVQITLQRRAFIWDNGVLGPNTYDIGSTGGGGLTSLDLPLDEQRIFSIEKYNVSNTMVNNVAGAPVAPLENGCGNLDAQPANQALFSTPHGITGQRVVNDSSFLYIADSGNHVIRGLSAVCTQICENGGRCVAADTCSCPRDAGGNPLWTGVDCTHPVCPPGSTGCDKKNSVCTQPGTCTCKPGYMGPNCDQATCIQTCQNGGTCAFPDTCSCQPGWFDSNCTTPVCTQTCANGGQCIAPDTCLCPTDWMGTDCRIPVCEQECRNGGKCMAPNTCSCPPQYINFDCSTPVCNQGMFKANPSLPSLAYPYKRYGSSDLNLKWATYKPCNLDAWCTETEEFECFEKNKEITYDVLAVPSSANGPARYATGRKTKPTRCMEIELPTDFKIPFELVRGEGGTTGYRRYAPKTPYIDVNDDDCSLCKPEDIYALDEETDCPGDPCCLCNPWRGFTEATPQYAYPWTFEADRQVALVDWLNMTQGYYVCANGGNCTAPDICECAEGWSGFDCRTPICSQGYYFPEQTQYVSQLTQEHHDNGISGYLTDPLPDYWPEGQTTTPRPANLDMELIFFAKHMNNNSYRLVWPYSNPQYTIQEETYQNVSATNRTTIVQGGIRYRGPANFTKEGFRLNTYQGGYRCSIRAHTEWENPTSVSGGFNFYSRYMDRKVENDGKTYTFWQHMYWPPVHTKSRILELVWNSYTNRKSPLVWADLKELNLVNANAPEDVPQPTRNATFQYTNEGFRRYGVWNRTANKWEYGTCIMEFYRSCGDGASPIYKGVDLQSRLKNVHVQDTDLAFRPRVNYTDERVVGGNTRWRDEGSDGECIDTVIRGCYNNGTCVGYDWRTKKGTCECAPGWQGDDCSVPYCDFECLHHGTCTNPGVCTCEKGWEGPYCETPICAQECQNKGVCVAPDTCQCKQFPSEFRDNRGEPRFRKHTGAPLDTGWTGFDCSIPICVQAQRPDGSGFVLNDLETWAEYKRMTEDPSVSEAEANALLRRGTQWPPHEMGGHGGDDKLTCKTADGQDQPRCPQFDRPVTRNDGRSYQSGCGWDPIDTGCCVEPDPNPNGLVTCFYCPKENIKMTNNTLFCTLEWDCENEKGCIEGTLTAVEDFVHPGCESVGYDSDECEYNFLDDNKNFKYCGKYHSPRRYPLADAAQIDIGSAVYFVPENPARKYLYSSYNAMSNYTSNRFLCNVDSWEQGDYNDDAGFKFEDTPDRQFEGLGSIYGLKKGRHQRINDPNLLPNQTVSGEIRVKGPVRPGEGLYACYNGGSCLGPDLCSCRDGFAGFDCNEPLCRHLRLNGDVSSCMNNGICIDSDNCDCVTVDSLLWTVHATAPRGMTGFSGSDCSIPMCTQGFYDPFCTDLPEAPAGQGCYRCANGGDCTAPDVCTCAPGWTGFDCKTPVCETFADPLTRKQLGPVKQASTVFEEKIVAFESDPCGVQSIYGVSGWKGRKYTRGNCTLPNQCTCLCKEKYNVKACHKEGGDYCEGPWQDPLYQIRNVLGARGVAYTFGTTSCRSGYEGNVDYMDRFTTCHLNIYTPSDFERSSITIIITIAIVGFFTVLIYGFIRRRLARKYLLAQIERRRSKRSSEESLLQTGAFNQ